jgi:hypothetical protein
MTHITIINHNCKKRNYDLETYEAIKAEMSISKDILGIYLFPTVRKFLNRKS